MLLNAVNCVRAELEKLYQMASLSRLSLSVLQLSQQTRREIEEIHQSFPASKLAAMEVSHLLDYTLAPDCLSRHKTTSCNEARAFDYSLCPAWNIALLSSSPEVLQASTLTGDGLPDQFGKAR